MAFSRNSMEAKKKRISWSEYKHDFIDPIASSSGQGDAAAPLEGHMDPAQRQSSDQFWLAYYAEEKERLHELNEHAASQEEESLPSPNDSSMTSYNVYKSKYLDPMEAEKDHPSGLVGKMDPDARASADKFWLQVVLEEKAKLHGKSSAATP
eukprot:CAMPEP_0113654960 /NCGR_PEP_ID=MMETSP0017_2-20120614/29435_1 /TAXON_ID=2856 /ORGANISM="Cylindrotheca closterium" /LENGTH=151 /DNA_ID=CAMNT_0000568143 /DNA_START=107 /DNA_END=562 /DNA_ORIENTATION=- /assembly_acc=CAM_ASM_000147